MNDAAPLLRFGAIGDLHIANRDSADLFRKVLRRYRDRHRDFVCGVALGSPWVLLRAQEARHAHCAGWQPPTGKTTMKLQRIRTVLCVAIGEALAAATATGMACRKRCG